MMLFNVTEADVFLYKQATVLNSINAVVSIAYLLPLAAAPDVDRYDLKCWLVTSYIMMNAPVENVRLAALTVTRCSRVYSANKRRFKASSTTFTNHSCKTDWLPAHYL